MISVTQSLSRYVNVGRFSPIALRYLTTFSVSARVSSVALARRAGRLPRPVVAFGAYILLLALLVFVFPPAAGNALAVERVLNYASLLAVIGCTIWWMRRQLGKAPPKSGEQQTQ